MIRVKLQFGMDFDKKQPLIMLPTLPRKGDFIVVDEKSRQIQEIAFVLTKMKNGIGERECKCVVLVLHTSYTDMEDMY